MPVTQRDVVSAALELIDEQGLDALTLRSLAGRLGVSAPTLYWHVKDKGHLLDLVAEQAGEEVFGQEGSRRQEGEAVDAWLGRVMRLHRRALLAHRDGARVLAGNRPTVASLPRIEQTLASLVEAGLEPGEAVRTITALGAYVIGDALETQLGEGRSPAEDMLLAVRSGAYPHVLASAQEMGDDEERFEHGLQLLLAGLRERLRELEGSRTVGGAT
ncbi:TetR family transcriptional regulator [Motilibacter rhizosphaerae]|uniref:TetR family transcriptional regulator n=1 Tax=Motilibacter rhizosphaerae TaxID=598652 RepID=A0A4Q7NV61_9ACTN|nr:TetR/AcrR family transcriptional regulator C-terminal domain-containing protein [Motilibacter rhizosphaerae]RZS90302.1 TetR family transcriptional regulator [Motilibacter rhizosphaerae]